MRKRSLKIAMLAIMTSMCFLGSVFSTVSWFDPKATITANVDNSDLNIGATSQGAYFAGGDGTEGDPYIITNKYHVYNLAWLQYIGYFGTTWFDWINTKYDGNTIFQPHFKLANNVDMEGLVIPPIGSQTYPFIGIFDGNSKTISNFAVSNVIGNGGITNKPTMIGDTLDDANIVGLFGVVGRIPNGRFPAGYAATNLVPSVGNLSIDSFTIQTKASPNGNLIGLAAGYVNGSFSGIAVGRGSFDIANNTTSISKSILEENATGKLTNLSEYSSVGYAASSYRMQLDKYNKEYKVPQLSHPVTSAGGNDFGASIAMSDIFSRVSAKYAASGSNRVQYISSKTFNVDLEGNSTEDEEKRIMTNAPYVSDYYYTNATDQGRDANGNVVTTASYSFAYNSSNNRFMYINGDNVRTVTNGYTQTTNTMHQLPTGQFFISDNNGNYLRSTSNTAFGNSTSYLTGSALNNECVWTLDGNGYLKNVSRNSYLYSNNGVLTAANSYSNNSNYKWNWDSANNYFYVDGDNYVLSYRNGAWTLNPTRSFHFVISYPYNNTTRYLNAPSNQGPATSGTSSASATKWLSDETSDGTYFYILNGANKWYLRYNGYYTRAYVSNSTTNRYYLSNSTSYSTTSSFTSTLRYSNSAFLVYNGSFTTGGSNAATTFTFTPGATEIDYSSSKAYCPTTYVITTTTTQNATYANNPSYFPLSLDDETSDGISNNNTGYIVSGGTNAYGDIRISEYPMTSLSNSFSTGSGYALSFTYNNARYYVNADADTGKITISAKANTFWATYNNYYYIVDSNNTSKYLSFDTASGNMVLTNNYNTGASPYALRVYSNLFRLGTSSNYLVLSSLEDNSWRTTTNTGSATRAASTSYSSIFTQTTDKQTQVITATANTNGTFTLIKDSHNGNYSTIPNSITSAGISSTRKTPKELGFHKYNSSRQSLCNMFLGETNIYGLHFMESAISMTNTTSASYVKIADKDPTTLEEGEDPFHTYSDYMLPRDSIDFILSKNGIINFFAGTYYANNETFFSLFQIERDSNRDISSIKEIDKIYQNFYTGSDVDQTDYLKNKKPYIYLYKDGTYSDPYPSHLTYDNNSQTLVFDMDWVLNPTIVQDALYYYEIPALKGEYALGSVSGKKGAYLFYLDIGAAAQTVQGTITEETITTTVTLFETPKGVDFMPVVNQTIDYSNIGGGDSASVTIPTSVSGAVSFTYSGLNLTCGPPQGGSTTGGANIYAKYIAEGYVVTSSYSGSRMTLTPISSSTSTEYRQTTSIYSADSATLVTTFGYKDDPNDDYTQNDSETITLNNYFDFETFEEDTLNDDYEGDNFVTFHYVILDGDEDKLSCTYSYSYSNYTYSFTFTNTSSEAIVIYISYIINESDLPGVVVMNQVTVSASGTYTVVVQVGG